MRPLQSDEDSLLQETEQRSDAAASPVHQQPFVNHIITFVVQVEGSVLIQQNLQHVRVDFSASLAG